MTFHHRPTFLRSLILENPSALGDQFGPEDVLRIEEEFPELFEPVDHHHESSKQTITSKPPPSLPFSTLNKAKLGNVKSTTTTTTMKKPTTATMRKDPFERLSQHASKTSQCTRDRCKTKPDIKPPSYSSSFHPIQVSNLNTKSKYSSLSERVLSNSINNSFHHQTMSLDNFEYEHDRKRMNPEKTRVVRVTNNRNNKVSTSYTSQIPEKLSNKIPLNVKLPNLSSTTTTTTSISRKRPVSSPTKNLPNTTSTTIAFSTPPTTPKFKPVSVRHNVQASKSIGFLKPVPILVKKRRNQLPTSKLKTPSPTVKFLDKDNIMNGYEISTNKTQVSSSQHRPHERIQSQSDTAVGKLSNSNNNINNSFTLSALKKLVEVRFGHYLQPSNINQNNQNKNENKQNIGQQQQQQQQEKHINENITKVEQQKSGLYNNNNNNNNNNQMERDLNTSDLSDILEGIENENTESFSSIYTLTSLGDEDNEKEEGEQKQELLSTVIPSEYNNYCNFNSSNVQPRRVINIKSQSLQQIQSQKEEQEEYLTNASVDRCEQLLLAKLLASKYEKDGKFRKSQTPSPRKTTTSTSLQPPLHSQLLDSFEKYNKAFELAVKENPDLLQKIAHELIHAEVKKIMQEEKDSHVNYPKTITINGRNEKVISMDPQKYSGITTKQERIKVQNMKSDLNEEMKSKYTFTSEYPKYKDASVNVNVLKEVESKDDEDRVSFEIPTPDLTPPIERGKFYKISKSQDQIETKNTKTKSNKKVTNGNKSISRSSSSSSNSSLSPVKTPTLSKMESLVHQIQCLEFSVQNKQQQQEKMKPKQPLDMTDCDCSELEDFVVSSEPLVREKDVINNDNDDDDNKPHRIIHDIIEECITNIPTPELTTPTISEHSLGRAGEKGNNNMVSSTPSQNHHHQQILASSSQDKKTIKIVKDIIKIDLNAKTNKEPVSSTIPQPKQIIHHPATDEIPCCSTTVINNKEEEDNDDLFYDYTKEKEMLEEIISQSQSQDDIKRRGIKNKKQNGKDGQNTHFDFETSEFSDSSLTSILELISDGELILNFNEEKSPGEVSYLSGATYPYYNISPGIHQRVEYPTTTTTSEVYDSSTFNAIGIDSVFSQSSGLVNE